ncbi:hypothetical protein [Rhodanobacter sp. L36]|uniref:hypothetical protein n=1 Tax=Rhodanobacter sp. L36 TaxID=1747221 RepID=UPI00131E2361|nr:hypothetical protein [Rhodanobacter sp. L36]
MSFVRIVGVIGAIVLLAFLFHRSRDPLRTSLPFGSADLSLVAPALQRLDASDRALVEAYVKRSNGDVLLPSMADPEQPFTARTFGEAIALEKTWDITRDTQTALAMKGIDALNEAMAPLRAVVQADVQHIDMMSPRQLAGAIELTRDIKSALPGNQPTIFVVTVSLHNLGSEAIVGVTGALEARDRDATLPLDLCWVDIGPQDRIDPAGRTEIRCADPHRYVSEEQRAFMHAPHDRYTVVWKPKTVSFEDGTRLATNL